MLPTMTTLPAQVIESPAIAWYLSLSLRQRMLTLLALAGLPGIGVAIFLAVSWLQTETQQIEVSMERLAKLTASRHDTVIEGARLFIATMAEIIDISDSNTCLRHSNGALAESPALVSLSVYNSTGRQVCSSGPVEINHDAAEADWINTLRSDRNTYFGNYSFGNLGRPLLIAAHPIVGNDGDFRGAVSVGIDLLWLDFLSEIIELPENATVTAIGTDDAILFHNGVRTRDQSSDSSAIPSPESLSRIAATNEAIVRGENARGSPRIYGVQKTRSGDITIVVGHTPYLAYAEYWSALVHTLLAPLFVLLGALGVAGWASEALVARHVRSLTRTAEAIGQGELSVRSNIPYSRYELGRLAAAFDQMAASIQDKQRRLISLVTEREMLIQEVHHRIKNNLQIVMSMIRPPQAAKASPEIREHLNSLVARVHTLARVHQLLYRQSDLSTADLKGFLVELVGLLAEFYETEIELTPIDSEIDGMELSIDQCVNSGLVLNELVSNAQKHAFEDGQTGRINVTVVAENTESQRYIHLIVADSGRGLSGNFDPDKSGTTGSRLIHGFAEQLRGKVWDERIDGETRMHFRFPVTERQVAAASDPAS
jgi:two-component sensor histidine kinase